MSIKFPHNFAEYDNENNYHNFTNIKELFNPAHNNFIFNNYWFGDRQATIRDFLRVTKLIYSRENLNNTEFLQTVLGTSFNPSFLSEKVYKMIIENLTDEELPIIALTNLSVDSSEYHGISDINNFNLNTEFRSVGYIKVNYIGSPHEIYIDTNHVEVGFSIKEKTFIKVSQCVTLLKELYQKTFDLLKQPNYIDKKWAPVTFTSSLNAFFNFFNTYILNGKYCKHLNGSSSTGQTISASKVYEIMLNHGMGVNNNNNNYTFNVTFTRRSTTVTLNEVIGENNKTSLYKEFGYQISVPDILPGKKKKEKEGTPIYIGMELEVSTDYSYKDLIDLQKELFFICKHDSSISGNKQNRTELVTRIGSIKWIKEQWANFFNVADYRKFDTTTMTTNGMHVHIGRDCFDDDFHVRNFAWMINNPANTPFIVALSERGSLEAMRTYCCFTNIDGVKKTKGFKDIVNYCTKHRGAVNFKGGFSAKTIEVRIFKGIVSFASIIKNLEFVESMFEFSRSLRSYRKLNLKSYFEFVLKTPNNKYFALKRFLEEINYEEYIVTAEIKELISGETDPERIIKLLNNSDIELTNEHISMLNRGKKRTYYLENGQIKLVDYSSKLSNFDKQLADRFFKTKKKA